MSLTTKFSALLSRGQKKALHRMGERVQRNLEWREALAARKRQQIAKRAKLLKRLA